MVKLYNLSIKIINIYYYNCNANRLWYIVYTVSTEIIVLFFFCIDNLCTHKINMSIFQHEQFFILDKWNQFFILVF